MAGNVRLYSVTSILKALPKEALRYWAVNLTARYAVEERDVWLPLAERDPEKAIKLLKDAQWDTSKKASERGVDLHRYAEDYVKGKPVPTIDEGHEPYAKAWLQFLRDFRPIFHLAEAPVYSMTYHYAGTLDAIVEIGGRRYVLDYKTTDKLEGGPPYPDTALQLAAYGRAEFVGFNAARETKVNGRRYYLFDPDDPSHEPMPEVDAGLILVVRPGSYNLVPVSIDEDVFESFLYVREVFRWQVETSKRVLGPELKPIYQEES